MSGSLPAAPPALGRAAGGAPFVWAHRGASALAPENTIPAFLAAAELGADGVELDVQLTADGVPVVLHDPCLWTDGNELRLRPAAGQHLRRVWVASSDWSELDGVPVWHPAGARLPVARLEEVLEAVPETLWLDVEIKAGALHDQRVVDTVLACLRRRSGRILVSSFDHVVLREVARRAPELPVLAILHARPVDLHGVVSTIPASIVCIDRPFVRRDDVVRWDELGLAVYVGGENLPDDLTEVLTWPVSGIFLDDPRLLAAR
ncbi:MAG TPA: glycerophosphodiester phosphodiesterase [Acidimicrobiales bacterium]|nr:glycerophosphodiester phosphodiesterase [Acidimicrobiales bacterium]